MSTAIQQIFLPGPVVAPHTVTICGESTWWDGTDIEACLQFQGDGSPTQNERMLNENYSTWVKFAGTEVTIDYGKGKIRRVLEERFGELFLV